MTVQTRTDKGFHRSQHPSRRPRVAGRGWWRLVRGGALTIVLVGGGYQASLALLSAPFLDVADIVVRGHSQLSEGEVLMLVEGVSGTNIFTVDLDRERSRLLASPWIQDGALRRVLPSTIEVFVTERRPLAVARFSEQLYLVDAVGQIIDEYGPRFAGFDLPIIDGLGSVGTGTPVVKPDRMALASRLLQQLATKPEWLDSISQIDVANPYDAVVLLSSDPALLHLGGGQFLERLGSYAELAPTLREQVSEIDYVDLRFGERVYVGPADPFGGVGTRRLDGAALAPAASEWTTGAGSGWSGQGADDNGSR